MSVKHAKQIVFRYNGDAKSEEIEYDLDGNIMTPRKGQTIARRGKEWEVVHVLLEQSLSADGPLPIVRVFLTNQPQG